MSWFEEWFDSPLYEKLYANRNEEEAALLADLIEEVIPKQTFTRILDLGCGRGRHSITLATRGYRVTGVDLSPEAIKKARNRAEKEKLENVTFLEGDMREPVEGQFDAILNLFTTFGYFLDDEENDRVLKNASGMLPENGRLMIDFLNPSYVARNLVPQESGAFRKVEYTIRRFIEKGMVFKEITFHAPDAEEPLTYTERVKLYDVDWFRVHLSDAGFSIIQTFGDYRGGRYMPEKSSRLIMLCSKIS